MIIFSFIRSVIMWLIYPLFLVFSSGLCIALNIIFNQRSIDNWIIKSWAKITCIMFNVKVCVQDEHKIPKSKGCLYLFNHSSFFDIWSMTAVLPPFRFGSKIEIFKIPIFGWAIRRVGVLPIDRERRETVFKVYEQSRLRLENGERFALSPEGTRQKTEKLGPFKSGPFIFAIQAKAPIVPIIIRNASKVMSKNSFLPNWNHWQQTIYIQVLDPITTESLDVSHKKELMQKVFDLMNQKMNHPL